MLFVVVHNAPGLDGGSGFFKPLTRAGLFVGIFVIVLFYVYRAYL